MPQTPAKSIWLELQIDPDNPELLAILDRLTRSQMLDRSQILNIAQACLSEELPIVQSKMAPIAPPEIWEPQIVAPIPSSVRTVWQNLKDELSVRWLLFLGVFLVILSSGVLAATQWSRFPAWGQYGLLWLYTIAFWVVGSWARKQAGLRLTANTLQLVTLLLMPVNFWAIDSFGLWQQPLGLVTASIAGIGLVGITYLKHQQQRGRADFRQSGLLLATYTIVSTLHLGWQIPYWSATAIYIGAIGVAIVLQKIRQIEGGALAIYGVGILLLRGLVVVHLPLYTFGLAIGIVGWLFSQWGLQKHRRFARMMRSKHSASLRTERYRSTLRNLARLYQQIGVILLGLGWLFGMGNLLSSPKNSSWQAFSVSILALVWLWQRLRDRQQYREVVALFFVGLQTYILSSFLWTPLAIGDIFAKIVPLLLLVFGPNYIVAGSLLIFPYLLLWVWLTNWFWKQGWHLLARRGELLIVGTGVLIPLFNLTNPLSLLLDLAISTGILLHLTLRYLPTRSSYIYITHLTGLATIFAALAYRWDWWLAIARNFVTVSAENAQILDLAVLAVSTIVLTAIELWLSAQPVRRETDGWLRSSWQFGLGLAILSYSCFTLLATIPAAAAIWPIWWLLVPIAFAYIATRQPPVQPWQLAAQTPAAWLATLGMGMGVGLTIDRPEWRSILLGASLMLMFPIVKRLKQTLPAAIHIGWGLGLGVSLLAGQILVNYWLVIGAVTCALLWFVSPKLPRIYAVASDRWAIGLAGVGLSIGSLEYAYNVAIDLDPGNLVRVTTSIFENSHLITLIATGILAIAIRSRSRWQEALIPEWVWFWSLVWTGQIALAAVVQLLSGNTLSLATANILAAFPVWSWLTVTERRLPQQLAVPGAKLLPCLLAGWGLLLRLPFFNAYTGLLTIVAGVAFILTSRQNVRAIGYLGILSVTLGCYELITHYLLQAPPGGNLADAFTIYGFTTALLALGYRVGVWWQQKKGRALWWNFPLKHLKNVAHIHWAVASTWKIAAATMPAVPVPQLTLLHLFISVLLGGYALIQARERDGGDWWIYVGLAELLGVGVYARSIFQNLGIVDEGLILIACLMGLLILLAPWRQWGWHDRPWRQVALVLPLSRVVFEWEQISLLNLAILAVFYAGVARRQRQFGWAYLSLLFINWAAMRVLAQYQLTSPLWYATLVGLSILVVVQYDPYWQNSKQNRHYGRLLGSGTIAITAILWHQPWLPIGIGLTIAILGIVLRVRAWLYVGTIAFILTNCYQLLLLITEYPVTKWAIGLLAGITIITLAANFERRKEQIERALQHWLDRLQEWE
ncbi:hypothetical protein [Chamaesiphon minutus]|uniref:DUF2157 domain-containing protein n=1 Tax=Chamaesiphon minutus (strain ATCC 27169 / PCC 6605) TaxID=1173020 RepID=K9UIU7_CHAP6|nr:hypothetical protein [Chamaesiphon minutus]AFY94129.1 hypothetical protein Cha6605_3107 [Chamaesiphon minutus PCC 6605]